MGKSDIAIIGMEVMGKSLALNMESKGYKVSVYNRTGAKTKDFAEEHAKGKNILPTYELKDMVDSLESPKKIMLMVKEGEPVDHFINLLLPLLNKGNLIIDGGNSFFKDTTKRCNFLKTRGILFIGTGVSGGEEGALKGPAIMPGGSMEAYNLVAEIFRKISAKAHDGEPCVDYIGPDGAGHFVKTVHNGIEYGDMQLIGESAWVLKNLFSMSAAEIGDVFEKWNAKDDVLSSYLIEITADSMKEANKEKKIEYLVDIIGDITRMKGTGTWTVQSALELVVPIPTIASAVFSREMSQDKDLRLTMSKHLEIEQTNLKEDKKGFINIVHDALYLAKISSYAQGFALLKAASDAYTFNLKFGNIAKGWRGGCIIRAQFLDEITQAFQENPGLPNLLAYSKFSWFVNKNLWKLSELISSAHKIGIPVPGMAASYDYILQLSYPVMFSAQVSALQRDYFGAHGYFKIGGPAQPEIMKNKEGETREFHTEWLLSDRPEKEITKI